ncbi:MAG: alpha-ribazole phosphatase [Bacteroidales bacterium]
MKIILIRHTSVDIARGICYGQSDVGLKPSFEKEASAVKNKLDKTIVNTIDPSSIFSSPLSRCVKLAEFCGFEKPQIDNRLMEMNFGDWEMQSFEKIKDPQLYKWYADWIQQSPTNGESFLSVLARVKTFLIEKKKAGHKQIVVFTHGGVIACTRVCVQMTPPEMAFDEKVNYGDLIELDF